MARRRRSRFPWPWLIGAAAVAGAGWYFLIRDRFGASQLEVDSAMTAIEAGGMSLPDTAIARLITEGLVPPDAVSVYVYPLGTRVFRLAPQVYAVPPAALPEAQFAPVGPGVDF